VAGDLFGASIEAEKRSRIFKTVDVLNKSHGKQTLFLGSSMKALIEGGAADKKDMRRFIQRSHLTLDITKRKKTLSLPYVGVAHCT
jgi:hypothetical protein